MAVRIIALCGPKGSGKDTVANYILTHYHAQRLAFADKMREVASLIYGIPIEFFSDPELKNIPHPGLPDGKTPRNFLEFIGETPKEFDPAIWVKPIIREILAAAAVRPQDRFDIQIVTDMRFPIEVQALEAVGAEFYYVYSLTAELQLQANAKAGKAHISELHCMDFKKKFPHFKNTAVSSSPAYEAEILRTFFHKGVTK